jgi:hypothetical protein
MDIRAKLDRVEQILVLLTRYRFNCWKSEQDSKWEAEEAWDAAATSTGSSRARDAYGPRERYAYYNIASLDLQRRHRSMSEMYKRVDAAIEAVRIIHRGLESVRQDYHMAMRSVSIETRLEA